MPKNAKSVKPTKRPPTSEIIPLSELGKKLPGRNHYVTVREWTIQGRMSVSGKIVKLAKWRMPWGEGTTMQAYEDFIDALQD